MKNIVLSVVLMGLFAAVAFGADPIIRDTAIMDNFSTIGGVAQYSAVTNVSRFPQKSVYINGIKSGGVYNNMSGTVSLQCAPTASGPWQTCKDSANNNVTTTTNTHFNLNTMIHYIRASWTKTKNRISVWLSYETL